jgi:hypothetical protein
MDRRTGANFVSRFGLLSVCALLLATGCSSAYYGTMEKFGQHKRDILKSRIEAGREDQEEAQEQFKTTYERFAEASGYDGGDFESVYNDLDRECARSEARAADVTNRIASIEAVAEDLFEEWKAELDLIQSAKLRGASADSLRTKKARYAS